MTWVYQIIEEQAEQDRVICRERSPTMGFAVVMDTKWDEQNLDDLYVVALTENRSLHTLRDLRQEHIPLLQRIRDETHKALFEKYGVPSSDIYSFLHYIPSHMQLHIHFVHLKRQPINSCLRCHLLDTVIENLQMDPLYYTKVTLTYKLQTNHTLYTIMHKDD